MKYLERCSMIMVECRRKVGLAGGSGLAVTMAADFEQTGRQLQENLSFYSESTTANITFHSIRTREYRDICISSKFKFWRLDPPPRWDAKSCDQLFNRYYSSQPSTVHCIVWVALSFLVESWKQDTAELIAPLYPAFNDTNNIVSESIWNNINNRAIFIDSTFCI